MIVFEELRFKNLLSYGNYWSRIKFTETPNTCIIGTNGNGKSVLLDALCFVLFGKPFRSIKKQLLVNSINRNNCVVEVTFNAHGKSYKVVRGISPNIFEIYVDGVIINQSASTRDYQDILEKNILKFNYKSFTQIVILGAASYTPFMQLSAGDRRKFIEDLLDIEIFSSMGEIFKALSSKNKDDTVQLRNFIALNQQKYELEKRHLEERANDNTDRIRELENEITSNQEYIERLDSEIGKLREVYSTLPPSNKGELEESRRKLVKMDVTTDMKVGKIKKDITFLRENDTCATCKQTIDGTFKDFEIQKMTSQLGEIDTKWPVLKEHIRRLEVQIENAEATERRANEVRHQINLRESQKKTLENSNRKMKVDIEKLSTKVKDESRGVDLDALLIEISEMEEKLSILASDRKYYDISLKVLKDDGIKSQIVKKYLPVINAEINRYLTMFEFYVNFNLDETFKETISSRNREEFSYSSFSEGEKARINLSILLAWRSISRQRNSANTNLLILDEVFDSSMDYPGIENLLNILHSMEDINVFVISHKGDVLSDRFNRVINVVKSKNFSKIKGSN